MFAGIEEAIAVFGADGALLFATRKGMDQLAGRARLSDLGYGIAADKLGEGASTMQVVHLSDFPQTIGSAGPPEPEPEAEPTIDLGAIAQAIQAASATLAQTPVAPVADASETVTPQNEGYQARCDRRGASWPHPCAGRGAQMPNAGIPCVSCGRWTPKTVSPSPRTNSSS